MIRDTDNKWYSGKILHPVTDRSYMIQKDDGTIMRRNTSFIKPTKIEGTITKQTPITTNFKVESHQNRDGRIQSTIQDPTVDVPERSQLPFTNSDDLNRGKTPIKSTLIENNATKQSPLDSSKYISRYGRTVKPVVRLNL